MAIYHLSVRGIAPARGSSAIAAAAYQSGARLRDERTGALCDYARKERVVESGIFAPDHAPAWVSDRARLWNEAERAHAGGTELTARRHEFALPRELDADERLAAVADFCALLTARGHAADWAIHDDGAGNPHAHVLETARAIGPEGFERPKARKSTKVYLCRDAEGADVMVPADQWKAAKAAGVEKVYNFTDGERRTMSEAARAGLTMADRKSKTPVAVTVAPDGARAFDAEKAALIEERRAWAEIANRHLAAHAARTGERVARIDHRSNEERGIDAAPTIHEGSRPEPWRLAENARIRSVNERIAAAAAEVARLAREVRRALHGLFNADRARRAAQRARFERSGRAWGRTVAARTLFALAPPPAPNPPSRAVRAAPAPERPRSFADAARLAREAAVRSRRPGWGPGGSPVRGL